TVCCIVLSRRLLVRARTADVGAAAHRCSLITPSSVLPLVLGQDTKDGGPRNDKLLKRSFARVIGFRGSFRILANVRFLLSCGNRLFKHKTPRRFKKYGSPRHRPHLVRRWPRPRPRARGTGLVVGARGGGGGKYVLRDRYDAATSSTNSSSSRAGPDAG